jgi:hypothetical protein
MNTSFYLTVTKSKRVYSNPALKVTLKKPSSLKENQVCIYLTLEIPNQFFERPTFQAKVQVDHSGNIPKVDVHMAKELSEILSNQIGVRVNVSAENMDPAEQDKLAIINQMGN